MKRELSTPSYLLMVVCAVLVPGVIFSGILFWRFYEAEKARILEDLLSEARLLALTVDRDIAGLQTALFTLTTSAYIAVGDFEEFYRQASTVKEFVGVDVLLRNMEGQQLANTRVPWGTSLPREALERDHDALASTRPVVSGLMIGAVAQRPVYTMTAVVRQNGQPKYFINLSLPPERLAKLLAESVAPNRAVGVIDRDGLLLTRFPKPELFTGKPAPQGLVEQADAVEGLWNGVNVEGEPVVAAYSRSRLAGWRVWTSVPKADVLAPLKRSLVLLAASGGALTAFALLLAYSFGRRLSASIQQLATTGLALQMHEAVQPFQAPVREVNQVARSLAKASAELHQREQELRRINDQLENEVAARTTDLISEVKQRAQTEEQLRQVQKMEAVGQLTGGIAHDFNNMLAIVLGNLEILQRRLSRGDQDVERFAMSAIEGAQRAAALTQRLLAFSRQQALAPEPTDVDKLVAGMSEMLQQTLGETIKIEAVLAGGLWRIHVDRNQLENALLNIAVNARDAMPEGGKLTIETANVELDDKYAVHEAEVTPGQYVLIAITDTGSGMSAQIVERAFDPFFTTKDAGQGTGLGLSQVYGFVRQSGGHVKIYSEIGRGTTVKLYLPRFPDSVGAAMGSIDVTPVPMNDGTTTVLVVEDEDHVRNVAVEGLKELGYSVLAAKDGRTALGILEAHKKEVDLLFTDVVMPDISGQRLVVEATQKQPKLRVLFTTGYARGATVCNGILDPADNMLMKPFTVEALARKIAEILKAPPHRETHGHDAAINYQG